MLAAATSIQKVNCLDVVNPEYYGFNTTTPIPYSKMIESIYKCRLYHNPSYGLSLVSQFVQECDRSSRYIFGVFLVKYTTGSDAGTAIWRRLSRKVYGYEAGAVVLPRVLMTLLLKMNAPCAGASS